MGQKFICDTWHVVTSLIIKTNNLERKFKIAANR